MKTRAPFNNAIPVGASFHRACGQALLKTARALAAGPVGCSPKAYCKALITSARPYNFSLAPYNLPKGEYDYGGKLGHAFRSVVPHRMHREFDGYFTTTQARYASRAPFTDGEIHAIAALITRMPEFRFSLHFRGVDTFRSALGPALSSNLEHNALRVVQESEAFALPYRIEGRVRRSQVPMLEEARRQALRKVERRFGSRFDLIRLSSMLMGAWDKRAGVFSTASVEYLLQPIFEAHAPRLKMRDIYFMLAPPMDAVGTVVSIETHLRGIELSGYLYLHPDPRQCRYLPEAPPEFDTITPWFRLETPPPASGPTAGHKGAT